MVEMEQWRERESTWNEEPLFVVVVDVDDHDKNATTLTPMITVSQSEQGHPPIVNKRHQCSECESAFATNGELIRHTRYKHTNQRPHPCPECDFSSVELSKLKRHIRCHTNDKPYSCELCTYRAIDRYKLKRHIRSHTGEKPFECGQCSARFSQSNSLVVHRRTHVDNVPSSSSSPTGHIKVVFPCDFCPVSCGRRSDLRIHVERMHSPSTDILQCTKCPLTFPDRYQLRSHIKSHRGEKCFVCSHCPYQTTVARLLRQHELIHNEQKSFHCPAIECGASFRQATQLRRHYNMKQSADKIHPCSQPGCRRSFRHLGNLKRHLDFHRTASSDGTTTEKNRDVPRASSDTTMEKNRHAPRKRTRPQDLGITNVKLRGRPGKAIEQMTSVNPEENIDREGLVDQLQMTFDEEDHSTTTKQTNLDPFRME